MSSAPVFPYPGGVAGDEPPDPTAGAPGHFAWSRWIKQFVKNLDAQKVAKLGDTMTGSLSIGGAGDKGVMFLPTQLSIGPLYDNAGNIPSDPAQRTQLGICYGPTGLLHPLNVAKPTQDNHAATRGYLKETTAFGFSLMNVDNPATNGWIRPTLTGSPTLQGTGISADTMGIYIPASNPGLYRIKVKGNFNYSGDGLTVSGEDIVAISGNSQICPFIMVTDGRYIIGWGSASGISAGIGEMRVSPTPPAITSVGGYIFVEKIGLAS